MDSPSKILAVLYKYNTCTYTVGPRLYEQLGAHQMCSDCSETCGLLNHLNRKMIEAIIRKCVRSVRHMDKETRINEV